MSTVDDMHAVIAAYLRRQRRMLSRKAALACRVCGALVNDDEGGLYNLDDMQMRRECRGHYVPF